MLKTSTTFALLILFAFTVAAQKPFVYGGKTKTVCKTAPLHKHDDVVTVEMQVVSWDGCLLKGTITGGKFNGKIYTLFGGLESNQKVNVKQRIKVTYDRSCGQVLMAVFPDDPGIR